jgi:tellurite resistance protein TerC
LGLLALGILDSVGSPLEWGAFLGIVAFLLALDLGVFHREAHKVTFKEALYWSMFWVALSLAFCGYVWWSHGTKSGGDFLLAYVVEKSLSVDNIFVFVVIFRYMKVHQDHIHRVLYAGILGALILRAIFIFLGLGLIHAISFMIYIFGGFLLFTGLKLLFAHGGDDDEEAGDNWVKRLAERYLRVTKDFEGPKFFVRHEGKLFATTLFVTLLMVETADVVFALDSIPAIFGITQDPYIVFTSNVCAILGLRAMFFLLEDVVDRFRFLPIGLGFVLAFIGAKMIMEHGLGGAGLYWAGVPTHWLLDPIDIETWVSLTVVFGVLTGSILLSLVIPPPPRPIEEHAASGGDDATP